MSVKWLIIDLRSEFTDAQARRYDDVFFFYPKKFKGFVESIINGSQRDRRFDNNNSMHIHIKVAYEQWLELQPGITGDESIDYAQHREFIQKATLVGELFEQSMLNKLDLLFNQYVGHHHSFELRDDSDHQPDRYPYAINPQTFRWFNPTTIGVVVAL